MIGEFDVKQYADTVAWSPYPEQPLRRLQSPSAQEWEAAMRRELVILSEDDVAHQVYASLASQHTTVIGTRWVFAVKHDVRFNARLVAEGF